VPHVRDVKVQVFEEQWEAFLSSVTRTFIFRRKQIGEQVHIEWSISLCTRAHWALRPRC